MSALQRVLWGLQWGAFWNLPVIIATTAVAVLIGLEPLSWRGAAFYVLVVGANLWGVLEGLSRRERP